MLPQLEGSKAFEKSPLFFTMYLWSNFPNVDSFLHPTDDRIVDKETFLKAAALTVAPRAECGLNLDVSMPAKAMASRIHIANERVVMAL